MDIGSMKSYFCATASPKVKTAYYIGNDATMPSLHDDKTCVHARVYLVCLGCLYCNGQGVEQSNEIAREWWIKSAEQGVEGAIKELQDLDKAEGRTTPSFIPKPLECASCYRPHDPSENKT